MFLNQLTQYEAILKKSDTRNWDTLVEAVNYVNNISLSDITQTRNKFIKLGKPLINDVSRKMTVEDITKKLEGITGDLFKEK